MSLGITTILTTFAIFMAGLALAYIGGTIMLLELPSINPAKWDPMARGTAYVWAVLCAFCGFLFYFLEKD